MACNIPNFNFDFKVVYDISSATPSVTIENLSSGGSDPSTHDYIFELYTPSGVSYHSAIWGTPDESGIWSSINIAEQIPQYGGHIEFSNLPYKVIGYARDSDGNICEHTEEDIICAPTGNDGKSNFGKTYVKITQLCDKALLQVINTSNYLYQGVTGTPNSNLATFVYPTDEGTPQSNAVVNDKMAFTLPIPTNSEGHELYMTTVIAYTLASGNEVIIKYKYTNKNIIVNCNISKCSIMCGLTKYREKIQGKNGRCDETDAMSVALMTTKIAQLLLGLNEPNCGFDVYALHDEIKAELLANDCYCECEDGNGNNTTTALKCADIDIQCVFNEIISLINADQPSKDQICQIVTDCVNNMNNSICSQVFISGVLFTETKITVNFQLAVTTNSIAVKVYYKLHSSGTWILADTLASNATTYDITGTFNPGDTYDVKVVNDCGAGGTVDSSIVTGIIIQAMSSQYLLDLIYGAEADGDYVVNVANNVTSLKKIDQALIDPFLPCPIPEYLSINSGSILSWVGSAGDYTIEYKLKANPSWTVYNLFTYGTLAKITEDLSALALSPLADYEFRVKKSCGAGDSLYAITSYNPPATQCKGPGEFISFDQVTGLLKWAGNDNPTATYLVSAQINGSPHAQLAPVSINSVPYGTEVLTDFSSIAALISANTVGAGDIISFSIYQDCGSGVTSDVSTHSYTVTSLKACDNLSLTFTDGNGGLISLSTPSMTSGGPNGNVREFEYQVGLFYAGLGPGGTDLYVPFASGTSSLTVTSVYSPFPLKNGWTIYVKWRAKCLCCDSDRGYSDWDVDTLILTNQYWDDEWIAIPNGWMEGGAIVTGEYKLDTKGKLWLRGFVDLGSCTPTPYHYPTGITHIVALDFLDLSALSSQINANTDFASGTDYWPATEKNPLGTSGIMAVTGSIVRNGSMLSLNLVINNQSGSPSSNAIQIGLSHISIQ